MSHREDVYNTTMSVVLIIQPKRMLVWCMLPPGE